MEYRYCMIFDLINRTFIRQAQILTYTSSPMWSMLNDNWFDKQNFYKTIENFDIHFFTSSSTTIASNFMPWNLRTYKKTLTSAGVFKCALIVKNKHCQRRNGPEGWVHLAKVTSWCHITSSNTNIDHISSSEFWLSIN